MNECGTRESRRKKRDLRRKITGVRVPVPVLKLPCLKLTHQGYTRDIVSFVSYAMKVNHVLLKHALPNKQFNSPASKPLNPCQN